MGKSVSLAVLYRFPISRYLHFLLLLLAIAAGYAYISGAAGPLWLHVARKTLPVLCLAAWTGRRGGLVTLGLLASALGEALLDAGPACFLPGVAAFVTAHLLYAAAFTSANRRAGGWLAIPFAAWAAAAYAAVHANLDVMSVPVAAYIFVICAMMWRSAAQAWPPPNWHFAWVGCLGAVMFGASDTLIALSRWSSFGAAPGWAIMALYWGGQALIAAWACVSLVPASPPAPAQPQ